MAVSAVRQDEFLELGGRVYALSADSPGQNSAVMSKLGISFPIFSDEDRAAAIIPLGFDDVDDPRKISLPGVVIVSPDGEIVHRYVGRDYADRPLEDELLDRLRLLGLSPTTQGEYQTGPAEPGPTAMPIEGLVHYFKGAKFANLALRRRHRHLGESFTEDTKGYVMMIDRYLEALSALEDRRA